MIPCWVSTQVCDVYCLCLQPSAATMSKESSVTMREQLSTCCEMSLLLGFLLDCEWTNACRFGLSALRASSNILFTSGSYDPFTACSPTVNLSDTITAVMYGRAAVSQFQHVLHCPCCLRSSHPVCRHFVYCSECGFMCLQPVVREPLAAVQVDLLRLHCCSGH